MLDARRPPAVAAAALAFGGWTLFVWVGRLRNLLAEPGSVLDVSRWSLVGSVAFTIGGLAVVASAALRWRQGPGGSAHRLLTPSVVALAGLTTGVWLVRAVDIALGDHSVGFIAVHLVLAAVSIGLAAVAVAAIRRSGDDTEMADGRLPSTQWVSQ
ncbi:MAG: hypothetical protein AAFO29_05830 [Actinomycetota bacterium]